MTTPATATEPTAAIPTKKTSPCLYVAIGCAVLVGLLAILAGLTCAGGLYWLTREAEVTRSGSILLGDESFFIDVFLDEADPALADLAQYAATRFYEFSQTQGRAAPNPLRDLQQLQAEQNLQDLQDLLPLRFQVSLSDHDGATSGESAMLMQISASSGYRQLKLLYMMLTWAISQDEGVQEEVVDGEKMLVFPPSGAGGEQVATAFVENHFFLASRRERLRRYFAERHRAWHELPTEDEALFERVGGRDAVVWGFLDPTAGSAESNHGWSDGAAGAFSRMRRTVYAGSLVTGDTILVTLVADFDEVPDRALAERMRVAIEEFVTNMETGLHTNVQLIGVEGSAAVYEVQLDGLKAAIDTWIAELEKAAQTQGIQ